MHAELLVIGGGPAALAAATGYRDADGRGTVLLVSDEDVRPYWRPPLSKDFLRGETDESELALEPDARYVKSEIGTRLGVRVDELDLQRRRAQLSDGSAVDYDDCVLATGAQPVTLPVAGADDPRVLMLRSLSSARRLRAAASAARSAVVIGSGFIGCEAATSLARRGLRVTVLSAEYAPLHDRLGPELGHRITQWLRADGIEFIGDTGVKGIEDGYRVHPGNGGPPIEADLVLMAAGVRPCSDLASRAGATVEQDRVVVDETMRSDIAGLLAAGDVALARNHAAGRHLAVEHWGEAQAMGTIAGRTVAGARVQWDNAPGFWTTIGDHTLKYAAWGDGYDRARLVEHRRHDGSESFTVWYSTDGVTVGVATHNSDDDYDRGTQLIEQAQPTPH